MADGQTSDSSFSRAFLPGLVLGLVVGGVAGAILPDLLGGSPLPDADPMTRSTTYVPPSEEEAAAAAREEELIREAEAQLEAQMEEGNESEASASEDSADGG